MSTTGAPGGCAAGHGSGLLALMPRCVVALSRCPAGVTVGVMARTEQRRPKRRLEQWQTLLAAALAAVAAIVVALILASDDDGHGDDKGGGGGDGGTDSETTVAISSITLLSAPPPLVRILGTATGVSGPDLIYVVARPDAAAGSEAGSRAQSEAEATDTTGTGTPWIASDPARPSGDGAWGVDFRLPADATLPLSFVAVIYPV